MTNFCKIAFACCILFVLSRHADGLSCYSCIGCNDPFSLSSAVTKTNGTSGLYCTKTSSLSYVTRDMSPSCTPINIIGNGVWCCQTDLCNEGTKLISANSLALALIVTAAWKLV